jgi:hypothetical protein
MRVQLLPATSSLPLYSLISFLLNTVRYGLNLYIYCLYKFQATISNYPKTFAFILPLTERPTGEGRESSKRMFLLGPQNKAFHTSSTTLLL